MSESDLIHIELLVHDVTELLIVHLPSAENLKSFLLESIKSGSLRCSHLLFDLSQLLVALVYFGLDDLAPLIQLFQTRD